MGGAGANVYAASIANGYGLDAANGTETWHAAVGGSVGLSDGVVYAASSSTLSALHT
jgi:hypothetical protein